MADDKQKLRDLFSEKTSGDAQAEEDIAPDEVAVSTEDETVTPEAPAEPEVPAETTETEVDVVKIGKDAYSRFEKASKDDPTGALDALIGELQELRDRQAGDAGGFLPGDEAPLNPPSNL